MTETMRRGGKGLRTLASVAAPELRPLLAKAGFAASEVVTRWEEIVGPQIARRSRPLRIAFPRRPAGVEVHDPGTLHVAVDAAVALEMQHMSAVVIERVNAYFGWPCVRRMNVKVAVFPRADGAAQPKPALSPDAVSAATVVIADGDLRAALERLGRAIPAR